MCCLSAVVCVFWWITGDNGLFTESSFVIKLESLPECVGRSTELSNFSRSSNGRTECSYRFPLAWLVASYFSIVAQIESCVITGTGNWIVHSMLELLFCPIMHIELLKRLSSKYESTIISRDSRAKWKNLIQTTAGIKMKFRHPLTQRIQLNYMGENVE